MPDLATMLEQSERMRVMGAQLHEDAARMHVETMRLFEEGRRPEKGPHLQDLGLGWHAAYCATIFLLMVALGLCA